MTKKLNRIKEVLARLDVSQKELASKWGRTPTQVSRVCTNKNQPSLEDLFKIAEILNVNVHDLIVSTEPKD